MRILHICAGWQKWNGAANIARMIMGEQEREGNRVTSRIWASIREICESDEVWVHCGWLPCLWWATLWGRRVHWMPEACYDPVRLKYHGWKKRLVGPIERFFLRRADVVVATCQAEAEWIRKYEPRVKKIDVTDIKRFFDLSRVERAEHVEGRPLHLLYLGRRHPLKGLEFLEEALGKCENVEVRKYGSVEIPNESTHGIIFRSENNAFGEEKEKVWDWCDVLVLPTLSENFGLVVAEALERGKRVITTDGSPAWGDGNDYGGRLVYLTGYRDDLPEARIDMLKNAIEAVAKEYISVEKV